MPRFNMYSLDPLCEGIDGDVFPLCGKYYEYEFSRETFERKVNAYRNANNIGIKDNNADVEEDDLLDIIKNFINQYYVYIITVILLIVVIVIIIIIINRKKRRNILK